MLNDNQREMMGRLMAYCLRHEQGVERTREGFVEFSKLHEFMKQRIPWVREEHLREITAADKKGRYEMKGQCIRARYGHSVEVELDFPEAAVDVLYYGTSPDAAKKILAQGLKPLIRQMVHLAVTVEDAVEVGRRHSDNPVVLVIDGKLAKERGVKIMKASERIYLAKSIPAECIKLRADSD
jgi:putative RNA 2'-phosphotransferase